MLPSVKSIFGTKYSDVTYCRIIMLFTGILTCLLSISMSFNPGTLLGILFMTTTNLGAPYFGTVLTGMFAPFVNRKGIIAGCFAPIFPLSILILRFVQSFLLHLLHLIFQGKSFQQQRLTNRTCSLTDPSTHQLTLRISPSTARMKLSSKILSHLLIGSKLCSSHRPMLLVFMRFWAF